jgi:Cu(I)/Ag(I) efflux system membrane fusion protein
MSRNLIIGVAFVAALLGIGGGYRLGAGSWTAHKIATPVAHGTTQEPGTARAVLYWKDPDGKADFSPAPKKTGDGRDYLPVYDEEEPQLAGSQAGVSKREGKGKLLYYRNPMGLADTSPVPKKDWMGMDYIAVYEGDEATGSTVKVSLDKVQRAGVRTELAAMRRLVRPIRAPLAKPDERTLLSIALRRPSSRLYVNETGGNVKKGEPLFHLQPRMVRRRSTNAFSLLR